MARGYIELVTSDGAVTKRFPTVMEGHAEEIEKSETIEKTIGGGLDKVTGGIYEFRYFVIKVPYAVTDANYGTYADLKYFYLLNNPNGSPSNVLTLKDNIFDETGVSYSVMTVGKFQRTPLTIIVTTAGAYSLVKLVLVIRP